MSDEQPRNPKSRKGIKMTRGRDPLATLRGCRQEACHIYRQAKSGKLSDDKARSRIWMLTRIREMVESEVLQALEKKLVEVGSNVSVTRHYGNADVVVLPEASTIDAEPVTPSQELRLIEDGHIG